jgi:HJR/Mrr/RecB family endonuclease
LRELIAPQILRRTKQDISEDLPKKHTYSNFVNMVVYQHNLYQDTITRLGQVQQEQNNKQRLKNTWGLLHRIKAICAEPYCLPGKIFTAHKPLDQHLANSPKMDWLLKKLKEIHNKGEKAIVFTELRQVQMALSFFIKQDFKIAPNIINGQTQQRQQLIDRFQEKQGFNVIILSPLAAGAGLNIVAANHVIHFTRTWNPAKEAQATDRAYRIGQTKDVHVYCPTVTHPEFMTFEAKLDELMRSKLDLASDMLNGIGGEFSPFDFDVPTTQLTTDKQFITLQDIDELDGNDFEKLCQLLLQKEGWDAQQTAKARGDGGIDIVAIQGKTGLLIQCKRSSKTLGWDAIKEVVAGSARYEKLYPNIIFTKIAMTNQFFNQTAKDQATHNCVNLWERSVIGSKLQKACINRSELMVS